MLQNYLKIAFRNLWRRKGYSIINVLGLAVGMACCILIVLYVRHEMSYDRFFANTDRIYRIALERKYPGRETFYAITPHSISAAAAQEIPEIQEVTRLFGGFGDTPIIYQNKTFNEHNVIGADSNAFRIFSLQFTKGNAATALQKPNSVVMTESTANRYFGTENPIGKIIRLPGAGANNPGDLFVTGVCKDIPENSHLKADLIFSISTFPILRQDNYISFDAYAYVLLKDGASPQTVEQKLPAIVEKYAGGDIERRMGLKFKDYQAAGNGYIYFLQKLTDIHLHSHLDAELKPNGNITYVYILLFTAVFIVVIASINFMNLATARSVERAREVGIRKTFGSLRGQIAAQFLTEAFMMSVLGLVIAVVIVYLSLPSFNNLTDKQLSLGIGTEPWILLLLLGFALVVGLSAGVYPAFVLSSFEPVTVLKGKFRTTSAGVILRNSLVVFQFTISIILIAGTIVVYKQLAFIQSKNLGFTKDWTIVVKNTGALQTRAETFKQEMKRFPGVEGVAGASALPGGGFFFGFACQPEGSKEVLVTRAMFADDDLIGMMDIKLKEGRGFSRDFQDSASVLLNETAVKKLGLTNPMGKRLVSGDLAGNLLPANTPPITFTVVGIVSDFHFQSLHDEITPLVLLSTDFTTPTTNFFAIRVKPEAVKAVLAESERLWGTMGALQPFSATFLDGDLAEFYKAEETSGKIFGVFAGLAIFVACIGLLGLAAYTTSQRTKEIGIRKVLGASVLNIVALLSRDILKLVVVAIVLAAPVAWWGMSKWLQDFAYRIELNVWFFVIAGSVAFVIAMVTVSYQAITAATTNPVHSLRSE